MTASASLAEASLIERDEAGEPVAMSLSGLRAKDVDLGDLKDFSSLKSLTLQECSWVRDDDLRHLQHAAGLEKFALIRTPITDAGLAHLTDLRALREVQLTHTKVVGSGLSSLPADEVIRLELQGESIVSDGLQPLGTLTSLRELVVNCPAVELSQLLVLSSLVNLERLDVRQCKGLDSAFVEQLKSLPSLERFDFDAEQIDERIVEQLGSLDHLKELDLTNAKVSTDDFRTLSSLQELRVLKLNGCEGVTDDSLKALLEFGHLRSLYLSHTSVRGAGLVNLVELSELKEISVFGGQLDKAGRQAIKEFEKLRPDCSIAIESQ